jgi:tyrosine-protein phosphatase YwqE
VTANLGGDARRCPRIDATFLAAWRHVRSHGFDVLIAHPERAAGLMDDGLRLRPAIADGALLQVDVSSLLGRHGPKAHSAAQRLIRDRLAHRIPGAHERAWRSPHEHRVRAAIVAARQRRS